MWKDSQHNYGKQPTAQIIDSAVRPVNTQQPVAQAIKYSEVKGKSTHGKQPVAQAIDSTMKRKASQHYSSLSLKPQTVQWG